MSQIALQPTGKTPKLKVAYHSACSMQHGQKITNASIDLLNTAGFEAVAISEGHLCCGLAGTSDHL